MAQPYLGPTVVEAAELEIRRLDAQIAELAQRRTWARARAKRYAGSAMLEAERVATAAEPFQAKQLVQQ